MIIHGLGTAAEADVSDFVSSLAACASITTTNISNWNSAYSWGDHSAAGYAVLAGQSGGQTLIGGLSNSENLTLKSTSAGTKGRVILGTSSAFHESTNTLTLGSNTITSYGSISPALQIRKFSAGVAGRIGITVQNTATDSGAILACLSSTASKGLYLQMSNPSYAIPDFASMVTTGGINFNFMTDGDVPTGGTSVINFYCGGYQANATHVATFSPLKRIGLGVTVPSYDLSFSGNAACTIALERHLTSNTAGNNLTNQAGGATVGATNKNGGTAILSGGIATGTGYSGVQIKTAQAGASGTADRTPTTIFEALDNKWAFGGLTPIVTPNITGSRSSDTVSILAQLLTELHNRGIITDSTTA